MANVKLVAKHKILLDAGKLEYAEPGDDFSVDSEEAERLIGLGAAKKPDADDKKAPAKKAAKDDDLV